MTAADEARQKLIDRAVGVLAMNGVEGVTAPGRENVRQAVEALLADVGALPDLASDAGDTVADEARQKLEGVTDGPWFTHVMDTVFVGNRADGREYGLWEIVYSTDDDLRDLKPEAAQRQLAD
ncbi:hypothetical protein, partial [Gordonia soli]|uniref:hypothetical protein n=1 Tax=Gordonia soli TaxID=320799 RepID=UPI00058FBD00